MLFRIGTKTEDFIYSAEMDQTEPYKLFGINPCAVTINIFSSLKKKKMIKFSILHKNLETFITKNTEICPSCITNTENKLKTHRIQNGHIIHFLINLKPGYADVFWETNFAYRPEKFV